MSAAANLVEQLQNSNDRAEVQKAAQSLIDLANEVSREELESLRASTRQIRSEDMELWKSHMIGLTVSCMTPPNIENPLSVGIRQIFSQIQSLKFDASHVVSSVVQLLVMGTVLLVFALLWPYGFVTVAGHSIWRLLTLSRWEALKTDSVIEKMPYTVAMGIYIVMWLPFALLSLPFFLLGWIGEVLSDTRRIKIG